MTLEYQFQSVSIIKIYRVEEGSNQAQLAFGHLCTFCSSTFSGGMDDLACSGTPNSSAMSAPTAGIGCPRIQGLVRREKLAVRSRGVRPLQFHVVRRYRRRHDPGGCVLAPVKVSLVGVAVAEGPVAFVEDHRGVAVPVVDPPGGYGAGVAVHDAGVGLHAGLPEGFESGDDFGMEPPLVAPRRTAGLWPCAGDSNDIIAHPNIDLVVVLTPGPQRRVLTYLVGHR